MSEISSIYWTALTGEEREKLCVLYNWNLTSIKMNEESKIKISNVVIQLNQCSLLKWFHLLLLTAHAVILARPE